MVEKPYKHFTNYRHIVTAVWAFGIIAAAVCIIMPFRNMPLWSIILVGGIAFVLIVSASIATAVLRVKIDRQGLELRVKGYGMTSVKWRDITDVKITTKYTPKLIVHDIRLTAGRITVKLKGDSYIAEVIREYGKYDADFKAKFSKSLLQANSE